jgi:chromatin remodeling complex protein RSC6
MTKPATSQKSKLSSRKTESATVPKAELPPTTDMPTPKKTTVKASTKTAVKKVSTKTATKPTVKSTPTPVEETDLETVQDVSDVEDATETPVRKQRRVATSETLLADLDDIILLIEEEITRLRSTSNKAKGVKFLRTIGKRVKTVRSNTQRVTKQRPRTSRKNTDNSGFLKPVRISGEMASFTGWDPAELKSRVDVTKYICKYIKDHDLQNPKDRRQILADPKLCELLNYDPEGENVDPLTYYRIQSYMRPHFPKDAPVVPVV